MGKATIQVNPEILKHCRIQIGLTDMVEAMQRTGVAKLAAIESGERQPTINQREKMAAAYSIPSWIFFEESLPAEYDFSQERHYPEFRQFARGKVRLNYEHKKLIRRFGKQRSDILNIQQDYAIQQDDFTPPKGNSPYALAGKVKEWLGFSQTDFDIYATPTKAMNYWVGLLEARGVLVFITSPYSHWSKIDATMMRGMAIYHKVLPIIIVNGSDNLKANLFTLLHELAHLTQGKTALDTDPAKVEKFCNEFASEILMPDESFLPQIERLQSSKRTLQGEQMGGCHKNVPP